MFDRMQEWAGLSAFVVREQPRAALGVVSGRRRQGKSFLLEALARESGGLYFGATEATEAESLRLFSDALVRHTKAVPEHPFRDWNDAISYVFRQYRDRPTAVVIDEFPFLARASPALPSIVQRELGPGGSGQGSLARLLLCGSTMSVMGSLLSGQAPLRGRAGLEMIVQPFSYREAAQFWGITDPRLALLVHMVVGGTPAYREEFVAGDAPDGLADFDAWVLRTVLNRQSPLFREARYLLAEESAIRDPAIYHSVLAAIATGNTVNGAIANYTGRKPDQIVHPLNVLEDCALIAKEPDLFRSGRARYRITEPLVTFYEAIMRRHWAELERGRNHTVWEATRPTFDKQVAGPHFEAICREFAASAEADVYGDVPAEVGSGVVSDPAGRSQIEIDVVVLAAQESNAPRRILSLGEAKWGEVMGHGHVRKLERARDLLTAKGYDTTATVFACYSSAGFTVELRAEERGDLVLVGLDQLYSGGERAGDSAG
ncbi:AAA family ATPase [Streptomyces smaragdinus]|uniref:AAA family ATPase n=1 Tax=Streptomyces smaragdinus TaxID=2585196 RepID=UPI002B207590|nr:ATP-binding protein [Streptomyces smaragdinus]